jgi:hypothetical protein
MAMNPFQMLQSHVQNNFPWAQQQLQNQVPVPNGTAVSSESSQKLQQSQLNVPQQNLPFNPLAFLPAPLSNEVLRLSSPVGSSPDDESILVKTLYECSKSGGNYRIAMESLHGVSHNFPFFYLQATSHFHITKSEKLSFVQSLERFLPR